MSAPTPKTPVKPDSSNPAPADPVAALAAQMEQNDKLKLALLMAVQAGKERERQGAGRSA